MPQSCNKQHTKKYISRKSPPYPANECCDLIRDGNDGLPYVSKPTSDGKNTCRWYKAKGDHKKPTKPNTPPDTKKTKPLPSTKTKSPVPRPSSVFTPGVRKSGHEIAHTESLKEIERFTAYAGFVTDLRRAALVCAAREYPSSGQVAFNERAAREWSVGE